MITLGKLTVDEFAFAYIECALWAETDQSDESGGRPLDKNFDILDIDGETLAEMAVDCKKFQEENWDDIACENSPGDARAGRDFWLTRNGHGAGFWDGDWPEVIGERLTAAAKEFGQKWLYVGDDGKIYQS